MTLRRLVPAAIILGWSLTVLSSQGQERPPSLPALAQPGMFPVTQVQATLPTNASINQQIAEAVALRLRQSNQLKRYQVEVVYLDGVAYLSGQVADMGQRDEVIRLAYSVTGVDAVRDLMTLTSGGVRRTQLEGPELAPKLEQGPVPERAQAPSAAPMTGVPQEPMSIMPVMPGPMPNPAYQPPPMPPYAWPTYAPYNNLSRVAYPTLYPYEAWPFIGPMYPFPKVPPGWRSVSLTWQDGYWWYGKNATGHDWWRVRYW